MWLRVLADQPAGARLQQVLGPAFADSGDAGVGLDRHHHVALVEERIGVRRLIDADPRDLHFGDRGARGPRGGRAGGSGNGQRLDKRSTVHGICRIVYSNSCYSFSELKIVVRNQTRQTVVADAAEMADTSEKRRTGLLKHSEPGARRGLVDRPLRIGPHLLYEIPDRPGVSGQSAKVKEGAARRAGVEDVGVPVGPLGAGAARGHGRRRRKPKPATFSRSKK